MFIVTSAAYAAADEKSIIAQEEISALENTVKNFLVAVESNDTKTLVDISAPPEMVTQIATEFGTDEAAVRRELEGVLSAENVESISLIDTNAVRVRTLRDGTLFALLPSETILEVSLDEGGFDELMDVDEPIRFRAESTFLALRGKNKWYLVGVGTPQEVAILKRAFPSFSGMKFPEETITPLD